MALLEAFRRAMDELDVEGKLFASDITNASSAFHKADLGIKVPTVGRIEYVPKLLDAVRKHRIDLLVPLTDLDLRSLARHRDEFAEVGCTVMVSDERAIRACRDKSKLGAMLKRADLKPIETFSLKDFRANPFYPCFIKPSRGSASIGTSVINNQKELKSHIATFGSNLIVQEYVPGQEFTVDVYRSRDGLVRSVVPRQRLVVRSGEVEKGITVKDDQIIEATVKLSSMLDGLWGVFCCQCRRDKKNRPRFFEINPRFGGGAPLSIAAGANLPLYLLEEILALPITGEIGKFTDHLLMMRYDDAVFAQIDDPSDLPGYNQPIFR